MLFIENPNESHFKIGENHSLIEERAKVIIKGAGNIFTIGNDFKANNIINILIEGKNNKISIGDGFEVNQQLLIIITGDNNDITLGNEIKVNNYLQININSSNNAIVKLGDGARINRTDFQLNGNFNQVLFGNRLDNNSELIARINGNKNIINLGNNITIVEYLNLDMNELSENRYIGVDEFTTFYRTDLQDYDMDSSIIIGKDCMFSYNTIVYNTDGHAIFQNGKLINKAQTCKIGNHVWVGWDARIMKNCTIPDGTMVARNALVCKSFDKPNVILAGIPAKIVKENIEWSRKTINDVLREQQA